MFCNKEKLLYRQENLYPNNSRDKNLIICNLFSSMKIYTVNGKHTFLQTLEYFKSIPFCEEYTEEFVNVYCKIKAYKNAFSKLARQYKVKHYRIYNTEDLCMTPIHLGDKNVISLLENNTWYLFHIRDLLKSMKASVLNSTHFYASPTSCKNPYTNLPFCKSNLYNIYFAMRESTFLMPSIIHDFFRKNFNLCEFIYENEANVRKEHLNHHVNNMMDNDVRTIFRLILKDLNMHGYIHIHPEFPKEKLKNLLSPYLKLYYISMYGLDNAHKQRARVLLNMSISNLCNKNPQFGRKIAKRKNKKMYYSFNSVMPSLGNIKHDFLTDHIKYDENFIRYYLDEDEEEEDEEESPIIHQEPEQILPQNQTEQPDYYADSDSEEGSESEDEPEIIIEGNRLDSDSDLSSDLDSDFE